MCRGVEIETLVHKVKDVKRPLPSVWEEFAIMLDTFKLLIRALPAVSKTVSLHLCI